MILAFYIIFHTGKCSTRLCRKNLMSQPPTARRRIEEDRVVPFFHGLCDSLFQIWKQHKSVDLQHHLEIEARIGLLVFDGGRWKPQTKQKLAIPIHRTEKHHSEFKAGVDALIPLTFTTPFFTEKYVAEVQVGIDGIYLLPPISYFVIHIFLICSHCRC